jgi:hypothetical protein
MSMSAQFSSEQLTALNVSQRAGRFNPLICGGDHLDQAHLDYARSRNDDRVGVLVATESGQIAKAAGRSGSRQ